MTSLIDRAIPEPDPSAVRKLRKSARKTKAEKGEHSKTLTDLRIAERMVKDYGADFRWCASLGFLVWDGKRWQRDDIGAIERIAKTTVRDIQREAIDIIDDHAERKALISEAMQRETANKLAGIVTLSRSENGVPVRIEDLDADPWALNVTNGTIDLKSGTLRSHRRADLITKLATVEYRPEAQCPQFDRFLARIFSGDTELIGFAQRAIGHALTGVVNEHVLHIWFGTGANGKSTLFSVLLSLLGDYAMTAPPKLLIARRHDGHPTELADLLGRRFVCCSESGEGHRLDEERVKMLTGGDAVKGRFMRENFFGFNPTHKLFLATNHRPGVRGTDDGIWRRLRLWPFTVSIPPHEQDRDLTRKLISEGPGILAWAVRGCLEWQKQGLNSPTTVLAATKEYRGESDILGAFLREHCTTGHGQAAVDAVYGRYKQWAENGNEHVLTMTAFGRAMADRGFESRRHGVSRRMHYFGIGLLGDEPTGAECRDNHEWARA